MTWWYTVSLNKKKKKKKKNDPAILGFGTQAKTVFMGKILVKTYHTHPQTTLMVYSGFY